MNISGSSMVVHDEPADIDHKVRGIFIDDSKGISGFEPTMKGIQSSATGAAFLEL